MSESVEEQAAKLVSAFHPNLPRQQSTQSGHRAPTIGFRLQSLAPAGIISQMGTNVLLEPIYGNGWVAMPQETRRDVPTSFEVVLHDARAGTGTIVTTPHEFEGGSASFSPTFKETTEFVTIDISRGGALLARGYAKLFADR